MPIGVRCEVSTAGVGSMLSDLQKRAASLKAVRAGIKVVLAPARAMAPKRFGHLGRAQGTKAKKGRRGKSGSFAVQGAKTGYRKLAPTGRHAETALQSIIPAKYDHLVIGGVKPHGVRKGKGVLRKKHPGARANPYRARVFSAVRSRVESTMIAVFGAEVNKYLAKAHAKLGGF